MGLPALRVTLFLFLVLGMVAVLPYVSFRNIGLAGRSPADASRIEQTTLDLPMESTDVLLQRRFVNDHWWEFTIDRSPEIAERMKNTSLVAIRMLVGCGSESHYRNNDRWLWRAADGDKPFGTPMKSDLGKLLGVIINRHSEDSSEIAFRVHPSHHLFQILCDDPQDITFDAIFRIAAGGDIHALITLPFSHRLFFDPTA